MKATFEKEALLLAITRSLGCVAEKMTSVIEGIYINMVGTDRCQVCAYDIEKGIKIEISAEVHDPGSLVINGAKLASIVKFMPAEVTLETGENNIITVSSGRSKFQLHYLPGSDFPKIPEFSPERHFTLPQRLLRKIINQTVFAISNDETRPALTGLYIEINSDKIKAVACDSFRLAVREVNIKTDIYSKTGEEELYFIIPGKTITELSRLLEDKEDPIKFSLTRKHIIFSLKMKYGAEEKDTVMFSRLVDANYIEYERFIPKESKTFVTVDRDALEDALERASLVTEDRAQGQVKSVVKFNFAENILHISAISINGKFFDEIPIEKTGGDLEIGFACKYLIEILRGTDQPVLKLSLTSSLMSMVIEGESEDGDTKFLYLALPMKMRDN
ncbi:MAG: DNA polymerase III subunit beta [Clostridia bacterium]|nr:DNA polymerase III subunit beta [Clostridia bacterium]